MMETTESKTFILQKTDPEIFQDIKKWMALMYLFIATVIVGVIFCFHLPYIIGICSILPCSLIPLLVILIVVSVNKKFQKQQFLELYDDKLVIKSIDGNTVMFNDIDFFKKTTYKILALKITLHSGAVVVIVDGLSGGLKPFLSAFEVKIKQFNTNNSSKITEQ